MHQKNHNRMEVAMARLMMAALAVMNLGFSVWVLFAPDTISAFVGLAMTTGDAQSEVRAMYAGLIGGLGIINLIGALNPARLHPALWATAWAYIACEGLEMTLAVHSGRRARERRRESTFRRPRVGMWRSVVRL